MLASTPKTYLSTKLNLNIFIYVCIILLNNGSRQIDENIFLNLKITFFLSDYVSNNSKSDSNAK